MKKWAFIISILLFAQDSVAHGNWSFTYDDDPTDPAFYVSVWKHSGPDMSSVHSLDLIIDQNGNLTRKSSLNNNFAYRFGQEWPYTRVQSGNSKNFDFDGTQNRFARELKRDWVKVRQDPVTGKSYQTCSPMITVSQLFSLKNLTNRQVIQPGLEDILSKSLAKLDPDQLTYFTANRTMKSSEVFREASKNPAFKKETPEIQRKILHEKSFPMGHKGTHHTVKTSSGFVVSGQTLNGIRSLPLDTSLKGTLPEKLINRKEFPLIWEIGRLSTIKNDDLPKLLEAMVLQMKSETALLKGNFDDAYIFAHSPDLIHTRLYENKYGMKKFSGYKDAPEESVLMVKVSDLEKKINLKGLINGQKKDVASLKEQIDGVNSSVFNLQNRDDLYKGIYLRSFEDPKFSIPYMTADEARTVWDVHTQEYFGFRRGKGKPTKYAVTSQYYDLKAVIFDGPPKYEWRNTYFDAFENHLAYFHLLKNKYGKFSKVENIVIQPETLKYFNHTSYHETDFYDVIKNYGLKERKMIHNSRNKIRDFQGTLFWIPVKEAERYLSEHMEKMKPLLDKIEKEIDIDITRKNMWSDPLPGT